MNIKKGIFVAFVIVSLLPFIIGADPKPYVQILDQDRHIIMKSETGENFELVFLDANNAVVAYCNEIVNGVGRSIIFHDQKNQDIDRIAYGVFHYSENFSNNVQYRCEIHSKCITIVYSSTEFDVANKFTELGLIRGLYSGEAYEYALLRLTHTGGMSKFEKMGYVFDAVLIWKCINGNFIFMIIPCALVAIFVFVFHLREKGIFSAFFVSLAIILGGGLLVGFIFKFVLVMGLVLFPEYATILAFIAMGLICLGIIFFPTGSKKSSNPINTTTIVVTNPVEQERKHEKVRRDNSR